MLGINNDLFVVFILNKNRIGEIIDNGPQEDAFLVAGRFKSFAFGDVPANTDQPDHLSLAITKR